MAQASLRSLEARMDGQLRAFGYDHEFAMPEGYYSPGYPVVAKEHRGDLYKKKAAGAALGLGGVVAYARRNEIKGAARTGVHKAGGGLATAGKYLRNEGLLTKNVKVGGMMGRVGKKLVGVGGRMTGFSTHDIDAIIDLAARVAQMELEAEEELMEFAEPEKQRGKVGMYMAGGPVALYDQKKHRESGLVYRKRDALKDGLKGTAANYGAAAATGAGVGLGALGLGALAAKRKLPKGMLRKVGVKAGQAMKKGSPKLMLGTGLAATAAGIGAHVKVQHGSAEKRRKAALVARLQGAAAE